jgi:hypothetical protein
MQWTGEPGRYEGWYLTVQDPESGWAVWLRVSLRAPGPSEGQGEAFLWAIAFPPPGANGGGALQLLDRYPLDRLRDESGEGLFALELGEARLELGSGAGCFRGEVGAGRRRVAWDLVLQVRVARGFRHVSPLLYRLGVASTTVATPGLLLEADGWLEVAGERIELRRAPAQQGHVFGRRHAARWAWAHCHAFEDAPGAIFEGVSAQVRKLGFLLPAASPLLFRPGPGKRLRWNGPLSLWAAESRFDLGRWTFEVRRRNQILRGTVSADPASFVSVEYLDPDGRRVYCNHTESADTVLDLYARSGRGWTLERRYRSEGQTAFEFGDERRDPRPRRRLDHVEARPA